MVKKTIACAIIFLLSTIVLNLQGTGIPRLINYQGILLDDERNPITGDRSIEFFLYDVVTGGVPVWSETQNVSITEGFFNVLLGSVTVIPYRVFNTTALYLTLKVESDPEMVPRKQLVSVGYAFQALNADSLGGKAASDFVQSHLTTIVSSVDGVVNDKGNIDLVAGSNVTITPDDAANTITISAAGGVTGDDLGNHTATQNIQLNGHWLSNDGGSEGISIQDDGDVIASKKIMTGSPSGGYSVDDGDMISTNDIHADDLISGHGDGNTFGYLGGGQYGGYGQHSSSNNAGYLGSVNYGVYGSHNSSSNHGYLGSNNYGAYGKHAGTNHLGYLGSSNHGAYGESSSSMYGYLGGSFGVRGQYSSTCYGLLGTGLYGVYGSGGLTAAVRGSGDSFYYGDLGHGSYGVYSYGNCHVNGTLSKSAGSFKIDHPLDPMNKYLQHSFVESPDMMNIYNGNVILDGNGEAIVVLPVWFETLNRDFRYQLTCIGGFAQVYIADKISDNRFKIAGGKPGMEVSWQVTGIRQDPYAEANRVQVEVEKKGKEQGKYQHPEVYGLSIEMRIDYDEIRLNKEMHQIILEEEKQIQEENERILRQHETINDFNPD